MTRLLAPVCLLLLVVAAQAQEAPDVERAPAAVPLARAELSPSRVVVGQAIRLRVTVLVPTWFPEPVEYPSFELANVMTQLPPDSSFPTNESVGGELWSGIVRDYAIYPLTAARYRMPETSLLVTYQDPDEGKPVSLRVPLGAIEFDAFVPAGAEGLDPFLSGRALDLEQEIEGDLEALAPGSAVKRTVTARIDGMAGMFLPEMLHPEEAAGRSDYVGLASVRDDAGVGERVESMTIVFERGGSFRAAALRLSYWDLETESVETTELPAIEFEVSGGGVPLPGAVESASGWALLVIASLGLALAAGAWRMRALPAALLANARRARERRLASEAHAFRQLSTTLGGRRADAREVVRAYLAWDRHPDLAPATASPPSISALRAAAYGVGGRDEFGSSERAELARELRRTRAARLAVRRGAGGLPPLNPSD